MTSIVEKAGTAIKEYAPTTDEKRVEPSEQPSFTLDFDELAQQGLFTPNLFKSQLALELRAVKRRLLRRLGYLRATGDRQQFRKPGRQRNLVLVTSSRAGEGKTYNAANLALSLALEDQIETLLVDADIPRPKVRKHFGLPEAQGVTDIIRKPGRLAKSMIWRCEDAPFSILPEGEQVEKAPELFAGAGSQRLWTQLSMMSQDQIVILDAPPVLATPDAVILAKYVDEIVFVVEANSTPEPAVAAAIEELLDINPHVSLLLNRCVVGSGGSHYGSYEYYGEKNEKSADARSKEKGKSSDE